MYYLESDLSKREYLDELKRCFRSPFLCYDERVCGLIIGPFFSVAYHSPHEWNRRITGEINRAWGYVKETEGKSQVKFIRGKGLLSPFWLVFYSLLFFLVLLCVGFELFAGHELLFLAISCVMALVSCLVTAFQSIITEQGEAGFHEITRLLQHPEAYFG